LAEESLDLTLAEAEHVVSHALGELVLVKGHGVVGVEEAELFAEADNSTSTAGSKLFAESVQELVGVVTLL